MYFLYILHSPSLDKYYIGETSDLEHRLYQHNDHRFKKGFTKAANDWAIVLQRECSNKHIGTSHALE